MRNRRQRRESRPLIQRVRPALAVGLRLVAGMGMAAALVVTAGWLARVDLDDLLELNQVRLAGDLRHVQLDDVEAVLAGRARGFFVLDLEAARRDLEALPWVETARLRKRWPDSLEVTITEPIPVARWGDDSLVDRHGEIFGPVNLQEWDFLPALEGESGRQVELMYRYLGGLGAPGRCRAWCIGYTRERAPSLGDPAR
jgi:cell division protein FtsQ